MGDERGLPDPMPAGGCEAKPCPTCETEHGLSSPCSLPYRHWDDHYCVYGHQYQDVLVYPADDCPSPCPECPDAYGTSELCGSTRGGEGHEGEHACANGHTWY